MAKILTQCVICKKEFTTYHSSFQLYCSVGCQADSLHTKDCGWHTDWHDCTCGAFDNIDGFYGLSKTSEKKQ